MSEPGTIEVKDGGFRLLGARPGRGGPDPARGRHGRPDRGARCHPDVGRDGRARSRAAPAGGRPGAVRVRWGDFSGAGVQAPVSWTGPARPPRDTGCRAPRSCRARRRPPHSGPDLMSVPAVRQGAPAPTGIVCRARLPQALAAPAGTLVHRVLRLLADAMAIPLSPLSARLLPPGRRRKLLGHRLDVGPATVRRARRRTEPGHLFASRPPPGWRPTTGPARIVLRSALLPRPGDPLPRRPPRQVHPVRPRLQYVGVRQAVRVRRQAEPLARLVA